MKNKVFFNKRNATKEHKPDTISFILKSNFITPSLHSPFRGLGVKTIH